MKPTMMILTFIEKQRAISIFYLENTNHLFTHIVKNVRNGPLPFRFFSSSIDAITFHLSIYTLYASFWWIFKKLKESNNYHNLISIRNGSFLRKPSGDFPRIKYNWNSEAKYVKGFLYLITFLFKSKSFWYYCVFKFWET